VIVTLTPNPSIDRTYETPVLVPGQVHRATRMHQEPSGKGVNVTRALTVNGIPSLAVLPCGGPAGRELASLLDDEKVSYRAVPVAGPVRINISLTEPGGRTTKINEPGPALTARELEELTDSALAAAGPGDWLVCSGSLPPGAPRDYYARAGQRAHQAGLRFALDTSGEALAAGLAGAPDVVKPNVGELAEIIGTQITALGQAIAGARELLARGAARVVVSLGPDGAALVTGDGAWHACAQPPSVTSTVGAGDALLAGFLAAGGAGPPALREAVTWATAAIGVEGSHVPAISGATRAAIHVKVTDEAHIPLDRSLTGSG
jgi:1-phosphofructokinase